MTYLFICGCGHSGTTLLAAMFAAHPEVYIPLRETNAFLPGKENERLQQELFQEFSASGRPHLVEKTPRHVLVMDDIRRKLPGTRFVLLVRDGRDVAASFGKRYGSNQVGVDRWIRDNGSVERNRLRPDCLVLKYEDIIVRTESCLRDVCAFATIPFHEDMLRYHEQPKLWFGSTEIRKGNGVEGDEHVALRNWQVNQPIFDGRGTWKGRLTEQDLDRFRRGRGAELMSLFGYDPDDGLSCAAPAAQ